ncbi:MAG: DUF885 domain-containing protein [Candidatus Limnocylindrales bacterium]
MPDRPSGPLDADLEALAAARFESLVERKPVSATFLGRHSRDDRLGDISREAAQEDIAQTTTYIGALEALDGLGLSAAAAFERDVALWQARKDLFTMSELRAWERRPAAIDEIGDGLFSLFARDFAPLSDRLESIAGRLEEAPRVLAQQPDVLDGRRVARWDVLELRSSRQLPTFLDEIAAAAHRTWSEGDARQRRLRLAISGALEALTRYEAWLSGTIEPDADDFALGSESYDELVALRAFDGLTTDDILEIGEAQLAEQQAARVAVAAEIDPMASEAEVLERIKSDHPATFEAALDEYRVAMFRARDHLVERDLVTIPDGERLDVIATPEYLRNVMPFAAYFDPPRFDRDPTGVYIVTPSVDGDPAAMREHNRASISNTSIHEAFPGHHLQLTAAITHPSLIRAIADAPEFTEGWGMYSEQVMREEGFDDAAPFRLMLHTDAIWRACRIILDVRLHRGEMSVADAIDFLVRHTGFERPNAVAEVERYTSTPTYQLSYLLGKVMILRLRDDERRRLGAAFSLKRFHDALIYAGSLPVSFHRRLMAGEGAGPAEPRPLPGR